MLTRSSASFIELATIRPSSARPKHSHDADRKDIERSFSVTQHDPFSLTRSLVDERIVVDRKPVKRFYEAQNEKIKSMLKSVDQHRSIADDEAKVNGFKYKLAIYGSLAGNVLLAGLQLYGAVSSGSLSLFATMIDAIFDPVSNLIMLYCHRSAKKHDETKYPSGKARLTTVGNICFCFIMSCASAIVSLYCTRLTLAHRRIDQGHHRSFEASECSRSEWLSYPSNHRCFIGICYKVMSHALLLASKGSK